MQNNSERGTRISTPIVFMVLLILITNFCVALFSVYERPLSPAFDLLYFIAFAWVLGWWLKEDSQKYKEKWIYELGILIYAVWMIVIPIYLFKTRGLWAFVTIFAFIGFYIGTFIIGLVASIFIKLLIAP
ncbi:MAG: hypothetical protein HY863_00995 [Chloroflexi bacterium]|nr:hypothetical protein [Chloroflexota bacterium]